MTIPNLPDKPPFSKLAAAIDSISHRVKVLETHEHVTTIESDLGGGAEILVSPNKIILIPYGEADLQYYEKTPAGLSSALVTAQSGDVVYIPAIDMYSDTAVTVPYNVKLVGASRGNSILRLPIVLEDKAWLENLSIRLCLDTEVDSSGVIGPASGTVVIDHCSIIVNNFDDGVVAAVQSTGGLIDVRHSALSATGTTAYGADATVASILAHHSSVYGDTAQFLGAFATSNDIDEQPEPHDCVEEEDVVLSILGAIDASPNVNIFDVTRPFSNNDIGGTFIRAWTNIRLPHATVQYGDYLYSCRFHTPNNSIVRLDMVTGTEIESDNFGLTWLNPIPLSEDVVLFDARSGTSDDPLDLHKYNVVTEDDEIIGQIFQDATNYLYEMYYSCIIGTKAIWFYSRWYGADEITNHADQRAYVTVYDTISEDIQEIELPRITDDFFEFRLNNSWLNPVVRYPGHVLVGNTLYMSMDVEWDIDDSSDPTPFVVWTYNVSDDSVGRLEWEPPYRGTLEPSHVLPYLSENAIYYACLEYFLADDLFLLKLDTDTQTFELIDTQGFPEYQENFEWTFFSKTNAYYTIAATGGSNDTLTIKDLVTNATISTTIPYEQSGVLLKFNYQIDDDGKVWGFNATTRHVLSWDLLTGDPIDDVDLSATYPTGQSFPRINGDTFITNSNSTNHVAR